jgi:hypothetical protein
MARRLSPSASRSQYLRCNRTDGQARVVLSWQSHPGGHANNSRITPHLPWGRLPAEAAKPFQLPGQAPPRLSSEPRVSRPFGACAVSRFVSSLHIAPPGATTRAPHSHPGAWARSRLLPRPLRPRRRVDDANDALAPRIEMDVLHLYRLAVAPAVSARVRPSPPGLRGSGPAWPPPWRHGSPSCPRSAAVLARAPMLLALRHGNSLEIAPVLAKTAPKAVVVYIPFRACCDSYGARESRGCGGEKNDEGT